MDRPKQWANVASGVLGFVAPTYFAWTVYRDGIPQNVATWSMIILLDALGLILVYKDGNRRPFLQLGWFAASFCILAAILIGESPWQWGTVETVSLLLCLVAIILWRTLNAKIAIFAYVTALIVSGAPLAVDYWYVPQPSTTWLWITTILTCFLSIYAAERRDVAHTAVPMGAIFINGLIGILSAR